MKYNIFKEMTQQLKRRIQLKSQGKGRYEKRKRLCKQSTIF